MDYSWIPIVLLALLASAFSSAMELAYISANKLKIELDRKQGVFGSGIIAHFLRQPKMYIATLLVGNNIALVIYGVYMGDAIVLGIGNYFPGMAEWLGEFGILITQTILSTIVVLIFGEFLPKAIVAINPNRWLTTLAVPVLLWYIVLWVFAWFVSGLSDLFLRLIRREVPKPETVEFGRIDLDHYLEEVTGNIDPSKDLDHEIQIFQNALDFSKVKARDCMIPRNEIVGLDITEKVDTLRSLFIQTRLSKILIFRENIDHIIGYVHSFELFRKPVHIQHVLRPVLIVPEPMPANEILEMFIQQKRNMAVVVDEFGGTAGIVTMEDIVEEIFGEIEDEHDKEETVENVLSDGTFEFSARLEIDYLNEKYELDLPANDERYDTLGGLILDLYEDIPEEGSVIEHEPFTFTISRVSDTRIELVRLEKR